MFRGIFTALATPFRDGQLDEPAYERLIETQVAGGVTGVVPVGTTGESPTLDHAEHLRVIELAVRFNQHQVKVIAGTGSNSTAEAISLTRDAERAGADAALLVAPYYNKPSQEGLYRHFRAIAESTQLPIVLYSIPGRCGVEIGVETVVRLATDCPNIVSIKEAGGSVERVSQLARAVPEHFSILCGDDSLTLPFLAAGASGVVSVASNIIPREVGHMVLSYQTGNNETALELHNRFYPLFKDLFIEPNPVPVKQALAWLGICEPDVRLPLCEMAEATRAQLRTTLEALNLLGQ